MHRWNTRFEFDCNVPYPGFIRVWIACAHATFSCIYSHVARVEMEGRTHIVTRSMIYRPTNDIRGLAKKKRDWMINLPNSTLQSNKLHSSLYSVIFSRYSIHSHAWIDQSAYYAYFHQIHLPFFSLMKCVIKIWYCLWIGILNLGRS